MDTKDQMALIKYRLELEKRRGELKRDIDLGVNPTTPGGLNYFPCDPYVENLPANRANLKLVEATLKDLDGAQAAPPPRIQWIANKSDFAELIKVLHKRGYIQANSASDALAQAGPHFEGMSSDPRSFTQLVRHRTAGGKAGKFDCIPAADLPKKT